ncbi:hypothetical protein H9L15_12185 [Sphingomonas daechungensis]|uniref:Uncharacterized protein n=1 Tax=Sphingomonas daechungensis TaxID=1176646 RepID=A0ABX6T635_9SPHN|nr:hypothetical protein H9L15_12185 [Sphingomonas daechungensis]
MVEGWQSANVDLSDAVVIRPSAKPVPGLRVTSNYAAAGPAPRLVILGCKPQQLDDVVSRLTAHLTSQTLVVSLLVGVELETLRQKFWTAGRSSARFPICPWQCAVVSSPCTARTSRASCTRKSPSCSRSSAMPCGSTTRAAWRRSARSRAQALHMLQVSSKPWPRPGRARPFF